MSITAPETSHLATVSIEEAGKLLGIGRTRAFGLVKRGEFPVPVYRIAGHKRIRVVDLEALFDGEDLRAFGE